MSWPNETEIILGIIREVEVTRLSHFDGCACGGFALRNVEVDIACGKGRDRGVWVSSRSSDWDDQADELRLIADEVARQIEECDGRGYMPRHTHEWERTHNARTGGGER